MQVISMLGGLGLGLGLGMSMSLGIGIGLEGGTEDFVGIVVPSSVLTPMAIGDVPSFPPPSSADRITFSSSLPPHLQLMPATLLHPEPRPPLALLGCCERR